MRRFLFFCFLFDHSRFFGWSGSLIGSIAYQQMLERLQARVAGGTGFGHGGQL